MDLPLHSWRMATGHHSGLRDREPHGLKAAAHQCLILHPGGNLGRHRGADTKQREPSQVLPTFCNRREPEYLVTMEYSSPPKASAQDFTLKKAKRRKTCVNNSKSAELVRLQSFLQTSKAPSS